MTTPLLRLRSLIRQLAAIEHCASLSGTAAHPAVKRMLETWRAKVQEARAKWDAERIAERKEA